MTLLAAGVDTTVIALWLGHEHTQTTQIYLHGDLTMKERALARSHTDRTRRPAATTRPTASSPSSKPSDYPGSPRTCPGPDRPPEDHSRITGHRDASYRGARITHRFSPLGVRAVRWVAMLSIAKLRVGQEAYQLSGVAQSLDDYYTGAGEAPAVGRRRRRPARPRRRGRARRSAGRARRARARARAG